MSKREKALYLAELHQREEADSVNYVMERHLEEVSADGSQGRMTARQWKYAAAFICGVVILLGTWGLVQLGFTWWLVPGFVVGSVPTVWGVKGLEDEGLI